MLEDLTPPVRQPVCRLREVIISLDETDQVILKDALANREVWSLRALSKALTDKGVEIGEKALARRDKPCGDCLCR
jgi:hypothetical protein